MITNDSIMKPMIVEILEHMRQHQRTISEEDVVYVAVKTMRDMLHQHGEQCELLFFDPNPSKYIS